MSPLPFIFIIISWLSKTGLFLFISFFVWNNRSHLWVMATHPVFCLELRIGGPWWAVVYGALLSESENTTEATAVGEWCSISLPLTRLYQWDKSPGSMLLTMAFPSLSLGVFQWLNGPVSHFSVDGHFVKLKPGHCQQCYPEKKRCMWHFKWWFSRCKARSGLAGSCGFMLVF